MVLMSCVMSSDGNEMVGSRSSASHFKTPKVPTGPRRRSDFVSHGYYQYLSLCTWSKY